MNSKSLPCYWFNTPKGCKNGSACKKPHIKHCRNFNTAAGCPLGSQAYRTSNCPFAHVVPCAHFNSKGGCKNATCSFPHVPYVTAPASQTFVGQNNNNVNVDLNVDVDDIDFDAEGAEFVANQTGEIELVVNYFATLFEHYNEGCISWDKFINKIFSVDDDEIRNIAIWQVDDMHSLLEHNNVVC